MPRERPTIGWREWVALPDLHIPGMKVKVDTGARTSALHAFDIELKRRSGRQIVRFKVHPYQRESRRTVCAEEELVEQRLVRNTSGKQSLRPVILTTVELMGERWEIELTLVSRDEMGFRMLLGREAVRGRFVVDPGRSFCSNSPARKTRKKKGVKKKGVKKKGVKKKGVKKKGVKKKGVKKKGVKKKGVKKKSVKKKGVKKKSVKKRTSDRPGKRKG